LHKSEASVAIFPWSEPALAPGRGQGESEKEAKRECLGPPGSLGVSLRPGEFFFGGNPLKRSGSEK
jgi:hypothetical protein